MIRVEAIQDFILEGFEDLRNIKRSSARNKKGCLYLGDTFECDKKMVDYLMGDNKNKQVVVKVIEVEPEIKALSQSPVEELEKAINVQAEVANTKHKKKKPSKK